MQDHREQCHDVHHIPLERGVVDSLIVAPVLFVLVWSAKEWFIVGRIKVVLPLDQKDKNDEPLLNRSEQLQNMSEISSIIAAGAKSFLKAEYLHIATYIVLFSGSFSWRQNGRPQCLWVCHLDLVRVGCNDDCGQN